MEEILIDTLIDSAPEFLGTEIERNQIQFQRTRKEFKGDLTLVIFPFVKLLRCSPIEAGERIGKLLQSKTDFISGFNVVSGFLNLEISSAYWLEQLKLIDANSRFGLVAENTLPTIMV